jgi:hypothetical protein
MLSGSPSSSRSVQERYPNQRAAIVHTENGDTVTIYDGRSGWIAAPNLPVPVLPLTGQKHLLLTNRP